MDKTKTFAKKQLQDAYQKTPDFGILMIIETLTPIRS